MQEFSVMGTWILHRERSIQSFLAEKSRFSRTKFTFLGVEAGKHDASESFATVSYWDAFVRLVFTRHYGKGEAIEAGPTVLRSGFQQLERRER